MDIGFIAERPLGYQQVLAAVVDVGFNFSTLNVPVGTSRILIVPESQAVRWRDDGIAATAAVGMPLSVGSTLVYTSGRPGQLSFISQVAGAILNVSFYAQG